MRLASGKARALVSKVYGTAGASYEIQTPTAVAGVRGTSFLIAYDSSSDATSVVGIEGRIMVRSLAEVLNNEVYVTASEATSVGRGMAPTKPEPVDPDYMMHESNVLQPLAAGGAGGCRRRSLAARPGATCRRRIGRRRRAGSPVRSAATSCATPATSPASRPPCRKPGTRQLGVP